MPELPPKCGVKAGYSSNVSQSYTAHYLSEGTLFKLYYCINTYCVLHYMNHFFTLFIGCIFTKSSDGPAEATDRPGATDLLSY